MATEIKIPIPDQTTEEVRIVKWQKGRGDAINKGDIVLEIETDKSVMEVEAVESGVIIKILCGENDMVPVGNVVGFIGQEGEKVDAGATAAPAAAKNPVSNTASPEAAVAPAATNSTATSATEIKIPIPDQTTEEVRIVKWQKGVGETVSKGEIILEIETDKSVMEVEATGSGVILQQLFNESDMVPVGNVVGYIGQPGAKIEAPVQEKTPVEITPTATTAPTATAATVITSAGETIVKASPVAKKLAAKLGIDLSQVKGTGPNGRIVRDDVENFQTAVPAARTDGRIFASPNARRLARELNVDIDSVTGTGPNGRIVGEDVKKHASSAPATTPEAGPAAGQPVPGTEEPISKMRRAIGANLQMSSRDVPHFNTTMSIDMSQAIEVRTQLNQNREKSRRISVNDLVVKACAVALQEYPAVNSRLTDTSIKYLADINIGIATAIDKGLVVPVLTNADQRNWDDLAQEAKKLAQQARLGKILNAGKGTFTISNLGMFGVDNFTAIINPPESAILAVGATQNTVVDIGGGIGVRPIMKVTLCSDHRVIDGALAAQFLQRMKRYLEEEICT